MRIACLSPALARLLLAAVSLVLCAIWVGGCSSQEGLRGKHRPSGKPQLIEADLDDDGRMEFASLGTGAGGIILVDGDVVYRSRAKWRVIQAEVADLDGDGLPEVVALVDSDAGRHLALFGWHGGAYRERLVSRPLAARPLSFTVTDTILEFLHADRPPESFRWQGFGFVNVDEGRAEESRVGGVRPRAE